MPVTIGSRTFGQVVVELARQRGLIVGEGTATAGTGTTLTDATNFRLPVANVNDVIGKYLYIYGGTSAGTIREVSNYGTIGVFTWSGTATTPDTTSTWVLLNMHPQYIIDAVLWAQRVLGFDAAVPYDSSSLISNNLLGYYGDFEEWSSGTTSAPDGWVLSGAGATVAQESTVVGHGRYSVALSSGAAATGYLTRTIPFAQYRGLDALTLTFQGLITGAGASQVELDLVTRSGLAGSDSTTAIYTQTLATNNQWTEINGVQSTLPSNLTKLAVQLSVLQGPLTGYADDLYMGAGIPLHEYDLPYSLIALQPTIWMEAVEPSRGTSGYGFQEDALVPLRHHDHWSLSPKSSTQARRIRFHVDLPDYRHLLIKGLQVQSIVTATATNLNLDADYVAAIASQHLEGVPPQQVMLEAGIFRRKLASIINSQPYVWLETSDATT